METSQTMANFNQRPSAHWLRVRVYFQKKRIAQSKMNFSHPAEPQCSYDPVEGLTLAPDTDPLEKIKQLEDQICELSLTETRCAVSNHLRYKRTLKASFTNRARPAQCHPITFPRRPTHLLHLLLSADQTEGG